MKKHDYFSDTDETLSVLFVCCVFVCLFVVFTCVCVFVCVCSCELPHRSVGSYSGQGRKHRAIFEYFSVPRFVYSYTHTNQQQTTTPSKQSIKQNKTTSKQNTANKQTGIPKNIGASAAADMGAGLIAADANAGVCFVCVFSCLLFVLMFSVCDCAVLCCVSVGDREKKLEDPCVFTLAYKKNRFYWFSQREPQEASGET